MPGPHILYRAFDKDGGLLYIGITNCTSNRFAVHECTTPWWHEVADIKTEEGFASRRELEEAEVKAIQSEYPFYNLKDANYGHCHTCWSPSPHFQPTKAIYGALTIKHEGEEPRVICTDPFHALDPESKAIAERVHANRERLIEMGVAEKGRTPRSLEWEMFSHYVGNLFKDGAA